MLKLKILNKIFDKTVEHCICISFGSFILNSVSVFNDLYFLPSRLRLASVPRPKPRPTTKIESPILYPGPNVRLVCGGGNCPLAKTYSCFKIAFTCTRPLQWRRRDF